MDMNFNNANIMGLTVPPFEVTQYLDNCGQEWKSWLQSFEYCMSASTVQDDTRKLSMLLHFVGRKVQEIYSNLPELEAETQRGPLANDYVLALSTYELAITKLNNFFLPKQNVTYERHVLRLMAQEQNENIMMFAMRLKCQAEQCDFGNKWEENVKDQIIEKCRSARMRRELLKQGDVSLKTILNVAKVFESIAEQEKVFMSNQKPSNLLAEVNKINVQSKTMKRKQPNFEAVECFRCGYTGHRAYEEKCPAIGKICNKCGGHNHFAAKCKSKRRIPLKKSNNISSINFTENEPSVDIDKKYNSSKKAKVDDDIIKYVQDNENEYVFCINSNDKADTVLCKVGQVEILGTIDSGSKYNLMDSETWNELKSKQVLVSKQQKGDGKSFKAYGGFSLTILGIFEAQIEVGDNAVMAKFYVMEQKGEFLIGRDTAKELRILKTGCDVNKINEVQRTEIGKFKNIVVDIPLRKDAVPVIQPYRRIAVPLEQLVDKKIDELLMQGIIEKVNGPSKWISPMVVIPKDDGGDVRICIDMRRANESIQRENYPLPTMENFLPYIGKAKLFTKLDIKQAFHQVEISEKSKEITTFITRKGLYRYTRLMFGITCAPEIFQRIMDQMLSSCEGCLIFIDDILVIGQNQLQLKQRVANVTTILEENGVMLNYEKCIYDAKEVEFLGHILSEKGIAPTKSKVSAIMEFREPQNAEEIRSFLGLVTYVGKFLPDLATITEPLRILTKKSVNFKWTTAQQKAFNKLKQLISSDVVLGYYDLADRTQLFTDASPVGLGAVLLQHNNNGPRVISYASKSLSDIEKRYCQTEKEALGLVWGVERFHYYLYGREFELVTDHKPLEVIFGTRSKPCARIERWVLRLQSYQYKIIYQKGKNNIADPLSRLLGNLQHGNTFDENSEHYVNWIATIAAPKALKLKEIIEESVKDKTILALKDAIYAELWTEDLKPFKLFESELCFANDILLRGTRIIMPEKLRERTIALAHEGHPGITVMKRRLRAKVWWPKIDKDVEDLVKNCRGCTLVSAPSAPEPIIRKELPSGPWQHLAIDFLGPLPSEHYLLVIVDYFSRFVEIEIMKKIDSTETIKRLKVIFCRFGPPLSITADNGKQFISEEFKSFCDEFNVELINTIPYWPQQNGEVERQNRSILKRLIISQNAGRNWMSDLQDYLLMYRSTPHSTTLKSPTELLFGRNIRDKLPTIYQPLERDEETSDRDKEKKQKEKEYADKQRHAKPIDIHEGDEVLVKRAVKPNKLSSTFEPSVHKVIKRKGGEAIIESTLSKKLYRRNVAHLKKVNRRPSAESIFTTNDETLSDASDGQLLRRSVRRPAYFKDFV